MAILMASTVLLTGIQLQPLEVIAAHEGCFYRWLSNKGKLGGQHKIPRLSNDRKILDELLVMNGEMIE